MSELEMTNDVETEEFTDELSDEALDRDSGARATVPGATAVPPFCCFRSVD
jgi:hypothetical protein